MSLPLKDRFMRGPAATRSRGAYSFRLLALFVLSFGLLVLSRLGHPVIKQVRDETEAQLVPVLGAAIGPFDSTRRLIAQHFADHGSAAEIEQLRAQNQSLRQWESRAQQLERQLNELGAMAKVVERQSIDYRTVRVVATSTGAFAHTALLEGGTDHGIKVGQPVISADGVLGRIIEAGRRTSRALLLTDRDSRIPVVVGPNQQRAILDGGNGTRPRLTMLSPEAVVEQGDEVLTAGIGGTFPRGLRVGIADIAGASARVVLNATLGSVEYVSVLLYDNPGVSLTNELKPPLLEPQPADDSATDRGGGE